MDPRTSNVDIESTAQVEYQEKQKNYKIVADFLNAIHNNFAADTHIAADKLSYWRVEKTLYKGYVFSSDNCGPAGYLDITYYYNGTSFEYGGKDASKFDQAIRHPDSYQRAKDEGKFSQELVDKFIKNLKEDVHKRQTGYFINDESLLADLLKLANDYNLRMKVDNEQQIAQEKLETLSLKNQSSLLFAQTTKIQQNENQIGQEPVKTLK